MRPDPTREQISLPEIVAGLAELEEYMDAPASTLAPFKVACTVYEAQLRGPFGDMIYESPKLRECVMFGAAAMDVIRYFRLVRHKSQLRNLRKHLALLGPGFFGIAGTYTVQQSKGSTLREKLETLGIASPTDAVAKDATRKAVELMLAMAAMNTFDRVVVEDPVASNAADPNPDLIIEHDGHGYGLACKSLSTGSEETIKERVAEGIAQLERAIAAKKVEPYRGVVLLDVSALLDHESLYIPKLHHRWPMHSTGAVLKHSVEEALARAFGPGPGRSFHDIFGPLFKDRRLPAGVLIYAHGLRICDNNGSSVPVYQKALQLCFCGDTSSITDFCKQLNLALHCQSPEK